DSFGHHATFPAPTHRGRSGRLHRYRDSPPENEVEVIHVEAEPDPDDLDVGYAQLASEFNSETADGERQAARDRYAGRTGEAA
ncbi:hypothetical protein ACM0CO_24645, partial [Mycobacteroides abscessus subsp. abscessus]